MNRKFSPVRATSWMKRAQMALTGAALLLAAQAVLVKPVSAALITYNANSAFSAMEAGSVPGTNPFLPFSVGYANEALSLPGSFVAFTAAEHTNSFLVLLCYLSFKSVKSNCLHSKSYYISPSLDSCVRGEFWPAVSTKHAMDC